MRTEEIEKKLADEVRAETPDVLDDILARCTPAEETGPVPIAAAKNGRKWVKAMYAAAAMLLLFVGGYFGIGQYRQAYAAEYTVTLDAGASVQLEVSKTGRVVSAVGLDSKGRTVIEAAQKNQKLKGKKLDTAVEAVVSAMTDSGTVADQGAVLVTVNGPDKTENAQVKTEVSTKVSSTLKENGVTATVLSQILAQSDELTALAQKLGVSEGRAALIEQTAENEPGLSESELAKLEIGALAVLTQNDEKKTAVSVTVDSAAASAYVSADTAAESACAKASASLGSAAKADVSAEVSDGKLVYKIKVTLPAGSAECEVDAKTGAILNWIQSVAAAAQQSGAAGSAETAQTQTGTEKTAGSSTDAGNTTGSSGTATPTPTPTPSAGFNASVDVNIDLGLGAAQSVIGKVHSDVQNTIGKINSDLEKDLSGED